MPYQQATTPRRQSILQATLAGAFLTIGALGLPLPAHATPFIGEVVCGGWNFCPNGWGECDGRVVPIAQNDTLFFLIGTTYGGDGETTFALPNIQGRTMVGSGQGPGLTPRLSGQQGGLETVTLNTNQIPMHNHILAANDGAEKAASPVGKILGVSPASAKSYSSQSTNVQLRPNALSFVGGSQSHTNLQPYLAVKCCIALEGIFPSQQ